MVDIREDIIERYQRGDTMAFKEIYEHTLNMLIGLELVLNSSLVVTDYSSNGSRFIKLKARDPNMVYDIVSRTYKFNFDKNICPSFSF